MQFKDFKNWLITEKFKDVFGMEKQKPIKSVEQDEMPINFFNVEKLAEELKMFKLGEKLPHSEYVNEIDWGSNTGAVRLKVHPDLHTEIARLGMNLLGEKVWITKKLFLINREGYGGKEHEVAQKLLEELERVDNMEINYPDEKFDNMPQLVIAMATKMRQSARQIHLYEGIKELDSNTYIIRFSVRGHGLEGPDHSRIIENQTLVHYDKIKGHIRLTNYNIETPVKGHAWSIKPVDTDVFFFPTQNKDEITEIIAATMRWY